MALRRNRVFLNAYRAARALWLAGLDVEYLRLRLKRAGCDRETFASDAAVLLHEATAGAMRDLDRLAAAALRETARAFARRYNRPRRCFAYVSR